MHPQFAIYIVRVRYLFDMTKFSPRAENPDYPIEGLKTGVFFKSENDVTSYYLIELCDGSFEGNALVKIYIIDIPDNHFKTDGLTNGAEIEFPEYETEWIAEVDLYDKYFYPKFDNERQMYYDYEKYYKAKYKSNSITSLMEALNFAIEYGLNKSGIVPY